MLEDDLLENNSPTKEYNIPTVSMEDHVTLDNKRPTKENITKVFNTMILADFINACKVGSIAHRVK